MEESPTDELYHYGILGQKWGVRRFQDASGKLTAAGKKRYGDFSSAVSKAQINALDYLNRQGTIDFLDSKASDPFTAVRTGYKTSASKDPLRFISNLSRYSDYSRSANESKDSLFDFYGNMRRRDKDQERFNKALDKAESIFDSSAWAKSLIDKNGQSVMDKKLGMISKDARDIERADAGRRFIDELKASDSVSKTFDRWYNTDFKGNKPAFVGKTYETMDVKVPTEHVWESIYDAFGKEVGAQMKATKYETVTMADISKPTQEFLDYHKSLVMPESYSNLYNDYSSIHDSNTYGMTDKYFSHDDFTDFLMHHGTKGQKWGHRQYQNKDGSLTPLGRVHYGVGAARKAVGKGASVVGKGVAKGASAIGKAIRKKNNKQTDEELNAELDKAKANYERKRKRELIDALNGKKKKVSDMTNQEVIDMINRYKNEKELKNLKKDANKSRARLYIEEAARKGLASAVENTTRNLLENIGQGVVDSADTEANKSRRDKEASENRLKEYENKEKLDKLKKGEKDVSEELKKQAQDAENAKKLLTNKLEMEALQGDPFAAKHIHDVSVASKGKRYSENSEEAKREKEEVQKIGRDFLNSTVYAKERKSAPLGLPAPGETSSSKSETKSRTSYRSNTQSSNSETNTNSSKKKKKKKRNQQDDDQ